MERWISVGIPLGKLDAGANACIYYEKEVFLVPEVGYRLWTQFRNGNSPESAVASAEGLSEAEAGTAEDCIKDLLSSGLLVPISQAFRRIPLRQGTAGGLEGESYTVLCPETVRMPFLCYFIWCCADGQTSPAEILAKMNAQSMGIDRETFLNAFYQLLQTDALALT